MKRFVAALIALALAACQREAPGPGPQVALWAITASPDRAAPVCGWILGTIHALPPGTAWRRPSIDRALADAGELVMEIGEPLDATIAGKSLARLAMTPGLPPPSARLDPAGAKALIAAYRKLGVDDARFADEESWAVALQLSAIASQKAGADADAGVEPQLRAAMAGKPMAGLETIDGQFAIFDRLDARAQTRLLGDVAREVNEARDEDTDMLALWLKGDELGLAAQANSDFLADPALHEALLTGRNRAWTDRIDALLHEGKRPLIAVGAAHVVGRDGLPAMLRARGWTVKRVF